MTRLAHDHIIRREPEEVLALLDSRGVNYDILRHQPVYTCAQAAAARNVPLRNELKTLLIVTQKGFALLNIPGDKRISRGMARLALSAHEFRLANSSEMRTLHVSVGTVSPLSLFGCRSLLDQQVLTLDWITTNAGTLTLGLRIRVAHLLTICAFEVSNLTC